MTKGIDMRKLLVAAAMAPLCFVLTAAGAAPQDSDILSKLTDKATEIYATKGYTPTGWSSAGTMQQGESKTISVSLNGAGEYSVVGMCNTACGDLNIVLKNAKGKDEASDLADDDFPIVNTTASGNFTAVVTMVKCKCSCNYKLVGYKK